MVFVKQIKPARFKQEVFNKEFDAALDELAKAIKEEFEKTTATWKNKPVFKIIKQVGPASIELLVATDDEIYGYVSRGTREHIIEPKNANVLVFPSESTPKTMPGVLGSGPGSSGGDTIYAAYVLHPGIKARKFEEAVKKKFNRRYKRRMEKALRDAVRASGHQV